jgi:hypothetical protein
MIALSFPIAGKEVAAYPLRVLKTWKSFFLKGCDLQYHGRLAPGWFPEVLGLTIAVF